MKIYRRTEGRRKKKAALGKAEICRFLLLKSKSRKASLPAI
jgi:hypothetical protein